ncbi:Ferritin subunit [Pseudolycoriella hygida]|uniref:Ferritin n=1 Tax=Pseudolycoriella hygida TaxID=35572 RepID=A0A9Q0NA44_9DIPT|nr:Ferritin subunit [Pseudolycoriella hygida]
MKPLRPLECEPVSLIQLVEESAATISFENSNAIMNSIFLIVIFCVCITFTNAKLQCESPAVVIPTAWMDMDPECVDAVRSQIQDEIDISLKYLRLGARFSQVAFNRPGFADFFFKSATDKRDMIQFIAPRNVNLENGSVALEYALRSEVALTKKIKYIIERCEGDDYHLVDYLTAEFLNNQYHDQRNLAEKIATLKKMTRSASSYAIGEFLFDEQFLSY